METDLHYAGALLNPYLLHDKELADDQDAKQACKRVLTKICKPEEYAKVVKEFMAFRNRDPPFHNMLEPDEQQLSAHAWWDFEGACGKLIAPIAKRILAQTVSSSSCERNWSSYSFVHNKSRNKLKPQRAADLVYVYSNSKVVAASKEHDEKKWYEENMESEDSEAPSLDDEDGEDGEPVFDDGDDTDYNTDNVYDETLGSPNWNNEDVGVIPRDVYEFQSDEDNCGVDEDVPPIGRYVNGTGYLSSQNILADTEDTHVQVAKTNVATFVNDETPLMDEVIRIPKSPSVEVAATEENDKNNDKGGCEVKVHVNVENTSIEVVEVLARKKSGAQKIEQGKSRDVDLCLMESRGSMLPRNDEGMHQSCSDDDKDKTLEEMFGRRSSHPPQCLLKSSNPTTQLLNIGKVIIQGGSGPSQPMVKKFEKVVRKRVMEPFAISPSKKQNASRTPLDACQLDSRMKIKPIRSLREGIGKSLLRAKKEKKGKIRRSSASKEQHDGRRRRSIQSSSDDMEDTSNDEDAGWETRGETSGAEVKGDSDYKP